MSPPTPPDAVPIREAARLVDRGVSTLRAWIAAGDLPAYRGVGTHPGNAPVLVSRAELLALAGRTKAVAPGRRREAPGEDPGDLAAVRAELATVRADLAVARAELAGARETSEALRAALRASEAHARDLAAALEVERVRARAVEGELAALAARERLPWWRRLLAPPMLAAPPKDAGEPGEG